MTIDAWVVGDGASAASPGESRQLTQARGRVLTRRVDGHHFAQFTLSGAVGVQGTSFDENAAIALRKSDLWVWRDGVQLARHRIVGRQVQVDADRWTINYQTVDYRGMLLLHARFKGTIPTWTSTDQHTIAWQMIQHRQAQTGGNWGITNGTTASGQVRDETSLTAGKSIGEAIDQLLARDNGSDWDISPALALRAWTPRRTRDNGISLDYSRNAIVAFQGSSPSWANDVIFTGAENTTPANETATDAGTDERGLWSIYDSSPNTKDQTGLNDSAAGLLADALTLNHDWSVRLAPGRWGGDDELTLGDLVTVNLSPVGFSGVCRVMEMVHVPGDDGVESITLGLREEEP